MMLLTLKVKLIPSEDQHKSLLDTMKRFNSACNYISEIAFDLKCANKIKLQKLVYYDVREKFKLSAQLTIRAISKVVEAYKRDKSIKPTFKENGTVVYDQRILSWKGLDRVSILTIDGRKIIPIQIGEYQKARLKHVRGQADLIRQNGIFYLCVIVEAPEEPPIDQKGFLGVDLGIVNLAVDSSGKTYKGDKVEKVREKMINIRSELQSVGTKSAKRHLKKLFGREKRFRKDVNHVISKELVAKAKRHSLGIALEDLKGIRERTTVKKNQHNRHNSWSFYQLKEFIRYKAKITGIPVVLVNPAYTSQECPICGFTSKSNRVDRDHFICKKCGFTGPADFIGAVNIARRAEVNQPIVSGSNDIFNHFGFPQGQAPML